MYLNNDHRANRRQRDSWFRLATTYSFARNVPANIINYARDLIVNNRFF